MVGYRGTIIGRSLTVLVSLIVAPPPIFAQHLALINSPGVTTQQRLESEPWWPTKSTSPLESYAGTIGCVTCHADVSGTSSTPGTAMARAASRMGSSPGLTEHNFAAGELKYFLHNNLDVPELTVSRGNDTASQKLDWVMGSGELGETFIYQREGRWYQSRLSVYQLSPTLDVTTGLKIPAKVDASYDLSSALGKALTTDEIRHCFSCHTVHATSSKGFNPAHAEAGLGCEACHGPGAEHANTASAKSIASAGKSIFNPAKLTPADSIDFCGACHRTFGDVTQSANPANDSSVVRFQPYRLEKSRCWRETEDARLTCVACHDPHLSLVREDASYDKRCLTCHRSAVAADHAGNVCPTGARTQCISCHMQKVKVASMHGEFTDHFIRVVKLGEGFQQ